MDYIELDVKVTPRQPGTDLLISELAETGFESFVETGDGFLAYIPATDFSEEALSPVKTLDSSVANVTLTHQLIAGRNWNEEWEKSFQPVLIANRLLIRAPFHEAVPGVDMELVIQPQQSFGTGHHPTTRLMAEKLLTMPLSGRYVLDMGCGTGVLAILAMKLGAAGAVGIDIEDGAVENAKENAARNQAEVTIEKGTEENISGRTLDVLLANINKNVLTKALPVYANALRKNGDLLLSGFFPADAASLTETAQRAGLVYRSTESDGEWALLHFKKP